MLYYHKSKYDVYFISQTVPQTAPPGSVKMSLKAENDQHLLLRAGTNRVRDILEVQNHYCPYSQLLRVFFATHTCTEMSILHWNITTKEHLQTQAHIETNYLKKKSSSPNKEAAKLNDRCCPSADVRWQSINGMSSGFFTTAAREADAQVYNSTQDYYRKRVCISQSVANGVDGTTR